MGPGNSAKPGDSKTPNQQTPKVSHTPNKPPSPNSLWFGIPESFGGGLGMSGVCETGVCWVSLRVTFLGMVKT